MLLWKTAEPVLMESYRLVTPHDVEETHNSNWYAWTLYGGRFANDDEARAAFKQEDAWTIIDNQIKDSVLQAENDASFQFACNNPGVYQYYRLVIHAPIPPQGTGSEAVHHILEESFNIIMHDLPLSRQGLVENPDQ